MTAIQRQAVALYHWYSSFIEAIAEHREVWLLTTHCNCRSVMYHSGDLDFTTAKRGI